MADGSTDYVTAQGADYDTAKASLEAAIPEGTKLIAIRKGD
jgi:pectin methylesterase-like acyl-CoA thioesterase